eukprot:GFUD01051537.1.p1 GENE.GFUD01051537.1~~GFUD01051537.1.p1  ORF type:complete len:115 (-),score=29.71 GFUD01051537.1:57-401(-)
MVDLHVAQEIFEDQVVRPSFRVRPAWVINPLWSSNMDLVLHRHSCSCDRLSTFPNFEIIASIDVESAGLASASGANQNNAGVSALNVERIKSFIDFIILIYIAELFGFEFDFEL